MEMYFTYILYSQSKSRYYIGSCANISQRLARHNQGFVRSSKYGIPWKVIYFEDFKTRQEAFKRERQIKSYKGGEAFKKLVN